MHYRIGIIGLYESKRNRHPIHSTEAVRIYNLKKKERKSLGKSNRDKLRNGMRDNERERERVRKDDWKCVWNRKKERDLRKWKKVDLLHDEKLECKLIYFIEGTRNIYCVEKGWTEGKNAMHRSTQYTCIRIHAYTDTRAYRSRGE